MSFIVDYKLPDSNMESKMDLKNYVVIRRNDVCKFVIASLADMVRAKEIVDTYKLDKSV